MQFAVLYDYLFNTEGKRDQKIIVRERKTYVFYSFIAHIFLARAYCILYTLHTYRKGNVLVDIRRTSLLIILCCGR